MEEVPQNENTLFHPYGPYAVAKLYGFWIVREYREAYNMFCCLGILFNYESERRGETFVIRKITLAVVRIVQGKQDCLYLGNLDSLRNWEDVKDYVEYMWLILQHDMAKVATDNVAVDVRKVNFAEYLEKGIVK